MLMPTNPLDHGPIDDEVSFGAQVEELTPAWLADPDNASDLAEIVFLALDADRGGELHALLLTDPCEFATQLKQRVMAIAEPRVANKLQYGEIQIEQPGPDY